MLFLEYEALKERRERAQGLYEEVLREEEELFARVLPSGVRYDVEKVSGGAQGDPFANYLIQKERKRIDERLTEARTMIAERDAALKAKEAELRLSDGLYDTVYRCRYIDKSKVKKIARTIGYSVSQTYRVIERIDEIIKMRKNEKNTVV